MPIAKDVPSIIDALQKMGVSYWDIARILAGETVDHDECLINPEDVLCHCEISTDQDADSHIYYITIDGHCVPDFFAGVISGELAMMDHDKLLAENKHLRSLNADAQEEIKRLRKKVDYLNDFIKKFKMPLRKKMD